MTSSRQSRVGPRAGERGFALVLAILSLMLLTFLGLTLATTTSTELQIATNYRWSQQALYNAEAGLESARVILSNVADLTTEWQVQLPTGRTALWAEGAAPPPLDSPVGRDFYKSTCDTRGGVGYGRVVTNATGVTPATIRYEDVSSFSGETLNGAFTIWVRRGLQVDNAGQFTDSTRNDGLIIVAEGRAPFSGPGDAFTSSRQAVRVLETSFSLGLATAGQPCLTQGGQEGSSPTGENFNPCAPVTAGAGGSLESAFGDAGTGVTGDLTSTGVE